MSDPFDGSDDRVDELAPGRGDVDKIEVPEWLILSGCSARALQLYQLLRLRLNRRRRDRKVWPGMATLAVMMKFGTSESVSPYVKELKKLGAIDVEKPRMPRRNIYRIHFAPPDDYAGPLCLEDWDSDARHRLAAKKIRDAEKEKRDKARAAVTGTPVSEKPQVRPDTGKNPDQARPGKTASPDTGKIPYQDPGKIPVHDPGKNPEEPLGVTPRGSVTSRRSTSSSGARSASASTEPAVRTEEPTTEQQEINPSALEYQEGYAADGYPLTLTDWELALVDELVVLRPDWGPRATRIAVGSPSVRARTASNPGLVRRAFLLAAADRYQRDTGSKGTWSPQRLASDTCPFWS